MNSDDYTIRVDLARQVLQLKADGQVIKEYSVSTGKNGPGEKLGSGCTPRGRHSIAEMIGAGCEPGTVFVGRQPTGEIYGARLRQQYPDRDWILTRIIWLQGQEPGVNKGGEVDTYNRYIYIHGAPDDAKLGEPASAGCVRMSNADVIELFNLVSTGCEVQL